MKYLPVFLLVAIATSSCESPVKETLAYSRKTISGIPGGPGQNPLPTSYLIYVVVKKGTTVSATGAYVQGKPYGATLKRVDSPVLVEHDVNVPTATKDTLVKKTSDDVYEVDLAEGAAASCGEGADKLTQQHEVVVCLKSGSSSWYGLAAKIVPLQPVAAP